MKVLLLQILSIAYGGVGVIGVIAYWPTIKDLHVHKKPSANMASYGLWTLTTGITFLYSVFILPNPLFIFVSVMNFLMCALVLFLSVILKKSYK